MKQPSGTTIEELLGELHITRRSVFRLLKTIEQKLRKPFVVHRAQFGGFASYHLLPEFIEKLSSIRIPETNLTFDQALFFHLIFGENPFLDLGV
jgi:hypothetical protein